jgi:hypothetical protein
MCYISTYLPTCWGKTLFGAFLAFLGKGEFKNTTKMFLQKVHVEKKLQKIDKHFNICFSMVFLDSVFRRFSAMRVQKHNQNFLPKIRVEELLQKIGGVIQT